MAFQHARIKYKITQEREIEIYIVLGLAAQKKIFGHNYNYSQWLSQLITIVEEAQLIIIVE